MWTSTIIRTQLVLVGLALAVPVAADMVEVRHSRSSERGITPVLSEYLGLETPWAPLGARVDARGQQTDWFNGELELQRVDDYGLDADLDLNAGWSDATDQVWTGSGLLEIETVARFGGYKQRLGIDLLDDDHGPIGLFTVSGSGFNARGSTRYEVPAGSRFVWQRSGGGPTVYSQTARNSDGMDHLVTYALHGLDDGRAHWLLYWEDLKGLGDRDYNDLVVHVAAPASVEYSAAAAIPEPATVVLLGLGAVVGLGRRR